MATIEKRGDSYRITVSCGVDVSGNCAVCAHVDFRFADHGAERQLAAAYCFVPGCFRSVADIYGTDLSDSV